MNGPDPALRLGDPPLQGRPGAERNQTPAGSREAAAAAEATGNDDYYARF